eukprot:CAMPEP_0206164728 /NCGR_PEP_ID=MMETSP1474-20131121/17835_1 /ASSEMBLY_ACC=CAM_ASM_001110 /TAXON_ID=97495 /ORGANISM="Imantonia sp., Strain RCC918" /LENGTH=52 /DNA_ID=CAMNT_0053567761 /DNA_START=178 /DNA_END=334 /DNA_ORIENTATION=+
MSVPSLLHRQSGDLIRVGDHVVRGAKATRALPALLCRRQLRLPAPLLAGATA